MLATAKYDPVSVYTSCAIFDSLFALFKHCLHNNQNNDYSCNQKFYPYDSPSEMLTERASGMTDFNELYS